MNDSENERLAGLASALARLERRQEEMLRRMERLEAAAPAAAAKPRREPPPVPEPAPCFVPPTPAAPPTPPPAPEPSRGFEARMGLMWVNRIGVVTLVLGVAFFFKYAVESGWLGVWARVLIGAAAGVALALLSERARRGGQRVYGQGLAGAGISILYLTVYAAFALYRLIPQGTGFLLMAVVTAAAVWLALRHASAALAGLGLAGGYATPLLLGAGQPPWIVLAYVLLLNAAALYLSRARGWQALEALALAGTVWLYAVLATPGTDGQRAVFTIFVLAYWGLGAIFGSRWMAIAAQVLAAFAMAGIWMHAPRPYFATALLLAAGGLAVADRRRGWPLVPQAALWTTHLIWAAAPEPRPAVPVFWFLTAAFLLFFAWLPWRIWERRQPARAQDLAMLAVNAGLYFALAYARLAPGYEAWRGPLAVVLAAGHMALAWRLWSRDERAALFAAAVAWALLVLAAPAQFAGYRVTQVWVLEAAAMAWIGTRLRQPRAFSAALAVFALALMRLLFIDTWAYRSPWDYTAFFNARCFTFLVAAACFWAASWWARADRLALATYVAGHFVALWGLSLEALGWAARTSADNAQNAGSTAVSILMAAYALALVGLGVSTGAAVNRALGLGLIGVVVAKLYLYDVWSLGLFYRMAAFAALGVLLLVMSYLYSRRQRRAE